MHSLNLSKIFGSEVQLIYVVEKSPTLNLLDRNESLKLLRNYGKKILLKQKDLVQKEDVKITTVLKEGKIVNVIVNYAKKNNFDLIVAGNKGLGATMRFLLGSVSSNLVKNSKVSVLIVK